MYTVDGFPRDKTLRWFGHVQRRDKDDAARKIAQMTVYGMPNRGRPKLRWRDLVKEDMARNQMTTEMAEDRIHWHVMIQAGTLGSVEADILYGLHIFYVVSGGHVLYHVSTRLH